MLSGGLQRWVLVPLFLLLFAAVPAHSQLLSFGLKAGVPLTSAYSALTSYDRPYIIGPTAELHLPFRLSFEVDALYRRNGYESFGNFSSFRTELNDWQIPFLGKYELKGGFFRPYIDAGVTYRHVSAASGPSPNNADTSGFTLGGGLTFKLLFLRLSPEIRYTHWGTGPYTGFPGVQSNGNQADFLVGFTF